MSDSVRPHRWQPTRLLRPWDSPGKNTGVGCHFSVICELGFICLLIDSTSTSDHTIFICLLISISIIPFWSIHLLRNGKSHLFYGRVILHCVYIYIPQYLYTYIYIYTHHIFYILSSVDGHLECFCISAILNNVQ